MQLDQVEIDDLMHSLYRIYCKPANQIPVLSEENYGRFLAMCNQVVRSEDIPLKKVIYWLILLAMYKGEQHGTQNHFIKLRNFFYDACPQLCGDFESYLKENFTNNNISDSMPDP